MNKLIAQGAESKLFLVNNKILKNRFQKKYRIKEIDERLRKSRTRREAKILEKLQNIHFPSPRLLKSAWKSKISGINPFDDEKENLEMEYIKGKLIKDILEKSDYVKLSRDIGSKVAILHNNSIIHGDLTTSNMILDKKNKIFVIDFGLGFFFHKIEDKATDLHLLKEALESKHYKIWEKCYNAVLKIYEKKAINGKDIAKRLKVVESRGRYKGKKWMY